MGALRGAEGADADALYLDLMAEHHRGGAHMADFAADQADDPGVRALAARMARNQAIEIAEFARTAKRRGFDIEVPPHVSATTQHTVHGRLAAAAKSRRPGGAELRSVRQPTSAETAAASAAWLATLSQRWTTVPVPSMRKTQGSDGSTRSLG